MTTIDALMVDPSAVDRLSPEQATALLAQLGAHQSQLGGLALRLAARLARTATPAPEADDRSGLLSTKQVAERLGFKEHFVRGLIQRGELPAVRVGQKYVRVRESALDEWRRHLG